MIVEFFLKSMKAYKFNARQPNEIKITQMDFKINGAIATWGGNKKNSIIDLWGLNESNKKFSPCSMLSFSSRSGSNTGNPRSG